MFSASCSDRSVGWSVLLHMMTFSIRHHRFSHQKLDYFAAFSPTSLLLCATCAMPMALLSCLTRAFPRYLAGDFARSTPRLRKVPPRLRLGGTLLRLGVLLNGGLKIWACVHPHWETTFLMALVIWGFLSFLFF